MKIGIVGSNTYENKRKIKQTVFDLTKRFGDRLIVVSGGGQHGADKYVKKYALELDGRANRWTKQQTIEEFAIFDNNYYQTEYQNFVNNYDDWELDEKKK